MTAILYARFSPRRNEEDCQSIETQLDLCREYCARQGFQIAAEFSDRALSGKDHDRPGIWQAVENLRRGYVLVVYRLDRLARDVYLSYILEREIEKKGASIRSVSGEGTEEDRPDSRLIRNILSALAQYEREVIAARTSCAMKRHQANGKRMSSEPPYGWRRRLDDPSLLEQDPVERLAVERIKQLHQEGFGLRAIARQLTAEGIAPRSGEWYHGPIKAIMQREIPKLGYPTPTLNERNC